MNNVLVYSPLIILLSAVIAIANVDIIPAGKCTHPDLVAIKFDFDKAAAYGRWDILYTTDVDAFRDVDNAYHEFQTLSSHLYVLNFIRNFKNKSSSLYTTTLTVDDGKIIEESSDEQGNIIYFDHFPLFVTSQKAALYIRCAERPIGVIDADVRIITIPKDRNLSEAEEQQLLEADRKFNFKGNLIKLPRQFA